MVENRKTRGPSDKGRRLSLIILVGLLLATLLAFGLVLGLAFSSWAARGQFGEAFGALSAVFSGAAFGGVVYALLLQQRQLAETRRGFVLEQQPFLSLSPGSLTIDPPRLYTSPGAPGVHVLSRYGSDVAVTNISQFPAVGAVLSARLTIPVDGEPQEIYTIGCHLPPLPPGKEEKAGILLVPDEPFDALFRVLRRREACKLPMLTLRVVYRNLMGGGFVSQEDYHVVPGETVDSDLKSWHATMVSFGSAHQKEFALLGENRASDGLFSDLQKDLTSELGQVERAAVELVRVPGSLVAEVISSQEYADWLRIAGAPRLTFSDSDCWVTKDE